MKGSYEHHSKFLCVAVIDIRLSKYSTQKRKNIIHHSKRFRKSIKRFIFHQPYPACVCSSTTFNEMTAPPNSQPPAAADFSCLICLDTASDPVVTRCGHLYCWACLEPWLAKGHRSCPTCKGTLDRQQAGDIIPLYGKGSNSSTTSSSSSPAAGGPPPPPGSDNNNNNNATPRPQAPRAATAPDPRPNDLRRGGLGGGVGNGGVWPVGGMVFFSGAGFGGDAMSVILPLLMLAAAVYWLRPLWQERWNQLRRWFNGDAHGGAAAPREPNPPPPHAAPPPPPRPADAAPPRPPQGNEPLSTQVAVVAMCALFLTMIFAI